MQYMVLIYSEPPTAAERATAEFADMLAEYGAYTAFLKDKGAFLSGEALQGTETATSLRNRAGRIETMDGPFAETKEHLGGFYLIDAPDHETALAYAGRCPGAKHGTVELRPIVVWN